MCEHGHSLSQWIFYFLMHQCIFEALYVTVHQICQVLQFGCETLLPLISKHQFCEMAIIFYVLPVLPMQSGYFWLLLGVENMKGEVRHVQFNKYTELLYFKGRLTQIPDSLIGMKKIYTSYFSPCKQFVVLFILYSMLA